MHASEMCDYCVWGYILNQSPGLLTTALRCLGLNFGLGLHVFISWSGEVTRNDQIIIELGNICVFLFFETLVIRWSRLCCRFSPAIFFFMVSIIPSIWILELHQQNKDSEPPVLT